MCALINCDWRESVAVIMVIWQVFTLRLELGVTVICLNKENSCKKAKQRQQKKKKGAGSNETHLHKMPKKQKMQLKFKLKP